MTFKSSAVLSQTGQSLEIDVIGFGSVATQFVGNCVGTLRLEISVDGINWVAVEGFLPYPGFVVTDVNLNGPKNDMCFYPTMGIDKFRVRAVEIISGSITVSAIAMRGSPKSQVGTHADTGTPVTVTLAGNTTLFTPTIGRFLILNWIGIKSDVASRGRSLVEVKIASSVIHRWSFIAGESFSRSFSRWGGLNDALILNQTEPHTLYVNFDVEDVAT